MDAEQVRGLVGRTHEVAALEAALDKLAAGEPWFLEIVGEPGIGKSRLLAELCRRGEDRGHLVLDGRAAEFERDIPFGLIVDALNDYLGLARARGPARARRRRAARAGAIFPALPRDYPARLPAAARAPNATGCTTPSRSLLERLASRQPLVLALDDVHWADAGVDRDAGPSAAAFPRAAADGGHLPSGSDAPAGRARGRCPRRHGSRLELAPLTASRPGVDRAARRRRDPGVGCTARAAGTRSTSSSSRGRARPAERASRSATRPGEAVPARGYRGHPGGADGGLGRRQAARSRRRPSPGDPFDPELIAAIAERTLASVLVALDELLSFDFIRPTDTPRRFRFRHPIVRRAVYDGMPHGWQDRRPRAGPPPRWRPAHAPRRRPRPPCRDSAVLGDEAGDRAARAGGPRRRAARPGDGGTVAARGRPGCWHRADAGERRLSLLSEAATALTYAGDYDAALEVLDAGSTVCCRTSGPPSGPSS